MTDERANHLAWAKARALEYLDGGRGNIPMAIASFLSDLNKHEETLALCAPGTSAKAVQIILDGDMAAARAFIDGVVSG